MRGLPTTYGSLAFKDNYQDDSEIVVRLRRAGALIVGKTNTPEFALLNSVCNRLGEPGCNPWDRERTCGGSSGGAAAAVAAGLGQIAIGTDSGGSIRQPAAYNGVFGLKPTYQRIPTVQKWRASPGRSHNGPLARTSRDAALVMQALAGLDSRDPDSRLAHADFLDWRPELTARSQLAVCYQTEDVPESESTSDCRLRNIVTWLRDQGFDVLQENPPYPTGEDELEQGIWGYSGDHYAAAESISPGFWDLHAQSLADYSRPVYEAGKRALAWQYRSLLRRNEIYRLRIAAWFERFDFLLTAVDTPAPRHGEMTPQRRYPGWLRPFNISHNPAAVVPLGLDSGGLPSAIQIVGRVGDDSQR
jgi:aspartyl-tRNA(Asn)/glutamyl-tRNA(Gln) amidotransferase subunit A